MTAICTVLAATVLATSAAREPDAAMAPPDPRAPADLDPAPSLQVSLLAGVWLPRLGGTSESPSGGSEIDLATQFQMEDMEPTLNIELGIRKNEIWELYFSGFSFETDYSGLFRGTGTFGGIALAPGDPFQSSFKLTSVSFELLYTPWRPYADGHWWRNKYVPHLQNRNADGRYTVDLRFSPIFGMRWLDVDQTLDAGGMRVDTGGEWLAAYVGLDMEMDYRPPNPIPGLAMFQVKAGLALGPALGGNGGFMWQVRAGLTVQFTDLLGAMFGYRLVELNVENDEYSLNGGLQGLFIAATLRF